jgi:hypothetical protein
MMRPAVAVTGALGLILGIAALFVWWRFDIDIKRARTHVAHGNLCSTSAGQRPMGSFVGRKGQSPGHREAAPVSVS